jgi:hypothetical protein
MSAPATEPHARPPVLLSTLVAPGLATVASMGTLLLIDAFADVSDATYDLGWFVAAALATGTTVLVSVRRRQPGALVAVFAFASLLVTLIFVLGVYLAFYILTPHQSYYCC